MSPRNAVTGRDNVGAGIGQFAGRIANGLAAQHDGSKGGDSVAVSTRGRRTAAATTTGKLIAIGVSHGDQIPGIIDRPIRLVADSPATRQWQIEESNGDRYSDESDSLRLRFQDIDIR